MIYRLLLIFLLFMLPAFAQAKCPGEVGYVIPDTSTETYTLGDGTVVNCAGLLVVSKAMLEAAGSGVGGDRSFDFKPGDVYTRHTTGLTPPYSSNSIREGCVRHKAL